MFCDGSVVLRFGKHQGKSFAAAYGDRRYVDWVLSKKEAARGQFLEFCQYSERERETERERKREAAAEKGASAPKKRKASEMDGVVEDAIAATGQTFAATGQTFAATGQTFAATGQTFAATGQTLRETNADLTVLLREIRNIRAELQPIARVLREARAA
jgi:hypothetical protein